MGHQLDRCDMLDILEEAVTIGRKVEVELRGEHRFVDAVLDVVTENGREFVRFADHPPVDVSDIQHVARAEATPAGYDGKLGHRAP